MPEKTDTKTKNYTIKNKRGSVKISEEVVSNIAARAASEVEGLAAMSGGITQGIAERLGRKDYSKGLKVKIEGNETTIDLAIVVIYGIPIQDITRNIQQKVKTQVEKTTGLKVKEVNINVQGMNLVE